MNPKPTMLQQMQLKKSNMQVREETSIVLLVATQ
jgi:hypothetical protein